VRDPRLLSIVRRAIARDRNGSAVASVLMAGFAFAVIAPFSPAFCAEINMQPPDSFGRWMLGGLAVGLAVAAGAFAARAIHRWSPTKTSLYRTLRDAPERIRGVGRVDIERRVQGIAVGRTRKLVLVRDDGETYSIEILESEVDRFEEALAATVPKHEPEAAYRDVVKDGPATRPARALPIWPITIAIAVALTWFSPRVVERALRVEPSATAPQPVSAPPAPAPSAAVAKGPIGPLRVDSGGVVWGWDPNRHAIFEFTKTGHRPIYFGQDTDELADLTFDREHVYATIGRSRPDWDHLQRVVRITRKDNHDEVVAKDLRGFGPIAVHGDDIFVGLSESVVRIPAKGGAPTTIANIVACDLVADARGVLASESRDGYVWSMSRNGSKLDPLVKGEPGACELLLRGEHLWFSSQNGVQRVARAGGKPQLIGAATAHFAVDGKHVYAVDRLDEQTSIVAQPIGGGPAKTVVANVPWATMFGADDKTLYWADTEDVHRVER